MTAFRERAGALSSGRGAAQVCSPLLTKTKRRLVQLVPRIILIGGRSRRAGPPGLRESLHSPSLIGKMAAVPSKSRSPKSRRFSLARSLSSHDFTVRIGTHRRSAISRLVQPFQSNSKTSRRLGGIPAASKMSSGPPHPRRCAQRSCPKRFRSHTLSSRLRTVSTRKCSRMRTGTATGRSSQQSCRSFDASLRAVSSGLSRSVRGESSGPNLVAA